MKKEWLVKTLALGIVALFICVSYQPIIAEKTTSVEKTSDYNNVDFEQAKEYLFQTIIDISINPDVKNLFGQLKYNQKIFTSDYDYKDVFSQLLIKKPRLLKSMLFSRPKMTYEYLEKTYNRGLEIVDILGEEESLKIVKSINITNPEFFNDLNNIILNNEELSDKISNLEKMNINSKSSLYFRKFPIICGIIRILIIPWLLIFLLDSGLALAGYYLIAYDIYPTLGLILAIIAILLFPIILILRIPFDMLIYLFHCESY